MTVENRPTERRIANAVISVLRDRLPKGWTVRARDQEARQLGQPPFRIDLRADVIAPDGRFCRFTIEVKQTFEPRMTETLLGRFGAAAKSEASARNLLLAASYLSPLARTKLADQGISYLDMTGNIRIEASTPGLFISADGADRDPWRQAGDMPSLRGRGAARALRAIIDNKPPFGVRELAASSGASAPTISRTLTVLERDGLVIREAKGRLSRVKRVDWEAAIRRWAEDYDQIRSNSISMYLEPRGIGAFERKLKASTVAYAATGSFAAQQFGPIAPTRLAAIYVENVDAAVKDLGLREVDTGANVMLIEPFDRVAFERTLDRNGLRCVAPSQLAVDLLTGPGREPSQGEEILVWMKENENVWHT